MTSNVLVIVEYGAQKQRISLRSNASFSDLRHEIYSLFKLDAKKSKYILQQQDPLRYDHFIDLDEQLFLQELKQHAINSINMPRIRLRLTSTTNPSLVPIVNGFGNSRKLSSQQLGEDESDRTSNSSTTTINIKQLIKKCLANLRETTDNIQLLDRCLHPEDYVDDETQSIRPTLSNVNQSSISINPNTNGQISHPPFVSDIRMTPRLPTSTNIVDELVPALNHLMTIEQQQQQTPPPQPVTQSSATPTAFHSRMQLGAIPQSSAKSFSNRLGLTPTQIPQSKAQEPKSATSSERLSPQKSKSPAVIIPPPKGPIVSNNKARNEPRLAEIPPSQSKCNIELKKFKADTSIEGIVSVASNASYFFLQLIDEKKNEFDQLAKSLHDYYSSIEHNPQFRPAPGEFCAAMYTEDARWYRARVVRYTSDQTCEVFYVDYGNMEDLPTDLLRELLPDFVRLPARAIACTIAEILPPIGQEGWTKRATFAFASRCSNERVQATIVDSTNLNWPMHLVHLRVSKTQENIGASLEDCKVARRVSNSEVCQFWSNKIRREQYILYNLSGSDPRQFPVTTPEQGAAENGDHASSNIFLSSSLQPSPITIDDVSTIAANTPVNHSKSNDDNTVIEKMTPITPSTILDPDATPFFFPTAETPQIESPTTDDEDSDEKCKTPITGSSEHCCIPIKREVIVDTQLMPSTPLLKSWLPVEVTHVETPIRFYIRYIYGPGWNLGNKEKPELIDKGVLPEKGAVLKELTKEMTECYSKHKRVCPGDSFNNGELVAVKSRLQWYRGRFIDYKPNIEFAQIFFVDYGYTRSVPIQMIRPINNRFVLHAEQAHLVHLHQTGHRRGRIEWNLNETEEFREMTQIDRAQLYARIVVEPDDIELVSYDPLTKTWFLFYDHYLVKHLNNNEIEQKT